jgi:hypothetical protein
VNFMAGPFLPPTPRPHPGLFARLCHAFLYLPGFATPFA